MINQLSRVFSFLVIDVIKQSDQLEVRVRAARALIQLSEFSSDSQSCLYSQGGVVVWHEQKVTFATGTHFLLHFSICIFL
jgi:hypothetical protein